MTSILKLTALLVFISISGCGEKDNQAKEPDPVALITQREALDKAKQVESTLQDAAAQSHR